MLAAGGSLACLVGVHDRDCPSRWLNPGRIAALVPASGTPNLSGMYSRSSEPVRFERDCAVVMVPQGEQLTLPAGSIGYITQGLGGSYTVFVEGNLFRVAGRDADAIGKEPPEPLE